MKIRPVLTSIFASAAILVVGWQAGAAASSTQTSTATTTPSTTTTTPDTAASPSSVTPDSTTTTTTPDTTTTSSSDGTYTGDAVDTRYGSVQVEVTISGGTITDVSALKLTDNERKSVQISNRAAPILREEVLSSQSANVDTVSGATYTSDAYLQSLQSALDQAGY